MSVPVGHLEVRLVILSSKLENGLKAATLSDWDGGEPRTWTTLLLYEAGRLGLFSNRIWWQQQEDRWFLQNEGVLYKVICFRYKDPLSNILLQLPLWVWAGGRHRGGGNQHPCGGRLEVSENKMFTNIRYQSANIYVEEALKWVNKHHSLTSPITSLWVRKSYNVHV